MIHSKFVHRAKDILGGTPVFIKTRVPVQVFIDYLEKGKSLDEFLKDFPSVSRKQTMGVLEELKKMLLEKKYETAA